MPPSELLLIKETTPYAAKTIDIKKFAEISNVFLWLKCPITTNKTIVKK